MKFKIVKHFSLDFLGESWKDCYLDFQALTMDEFKKFSALTSVDTNNFDSVTKGFDDTIEILKKNFIAGKGIGSDGQMIDVKPEDIKELPPEVINRATAFLLPTQEKKT